MTNLDNLLKDVIDDAISVGFPIPDSLEHKIYLDKDRYDRVGACYRYICPERYEIHLSEATAKANINEIKNIIAHEVLHSCFLSMDHGPIWTMYRDLMNDKFRYDIKIKYSWHEILKK